MIPVVKQIERRTCPNCTRSLPANMDFFHINKAGIAVGRCKKCKTIAGTVQQHERRNVDPRVGLLKSIKKSARIRGLECNITLEDIVIPDYCPVFGVKLAREDGKALPTTPSVDRIDSSKGYIKGNVQVISMRANMLKSNASIEELEAVLKFIKENGGRASS